MIYNRLSNKTMQRKRAFRGLVLVEQIDGENIVYKSFANKPTNHSKRDFKQMDGFKRVRCTGGKKDPCKCSRLLPIIRRPSKGQRRAQKKEQMKHKLMSDIE